MAQHLDNGRLAEEIARRYLSGRGLRTVATNYRCRYGELDLVMCHSNLLVIIETRYRRSNSYGGPIESISPAKRRKIVKSTQHFVHRFPVYRNMPVRFDVVGLTGMLAAPDIRWIPGAFTLDNINR